jgi:GNAT superfamily N-acetyltransferase
MIRWGDECARVGPWRSDRTIALVAPVPGAPASADFVRRCAQLLARQGYEKAITAALSTREQLGFLEAGFCVHEHLHLLLLDRSVSIPPSLPRPHLRRATPARRRGLLAVDAVAFSPFWRLDQAGLREALSATPRRRLRVVLGGDHKVTGYAICGASGPRGFVQRLAVEPSCQGQGIGKKLLLDGLEWLRRVGTVEIAVNTQEGNEAALALYRNVGFRDDLYGLSVLSADLRSRRGTGLTMGASSPNDDQVVRECRD